jgi:hypothetical protein
MKMKSIREGRDVEDLQETAFSGTVEKNPTKSSQFSRVSDQGLIFLLAGNQSLKWVLKLPARRVGTM